jgi:putative DNA primase/helicase
MLKTPIEEVTSLLICGLALVKIPKREKSPNSLGWNKRVNVITRPEDALQLIQSNIGLAHAYCEPYPTCAIDLDNLEESKAWFSSNNVNLDDLIGAADAVHIVSGKANRLKLLYQNRKGLMASAVVKNDNKQVIVEFRCATRDGLTVQDILPPSIHPETLQPYQWDGLGHFSDIPIIPDCLLAIWEGLLIREDKTKATITSSLPETPRAVSQVEHALSQIPADCSYDIWRNVIWGLLNTGWSCSVELAMTWSKTAPELYNEAVFNNVVDGYDPRHKDSPTLGTVYYLAKKGGQV